MKDHPRLAGSSVNVLGTRVREKNERNVKAQARRKQILAAYEKKKAEAQRKGTKAPKYPKESDLLHSGELSYALAS